MDNHSVILFHSTNHAIWTSKVLKKEGIEGKMISVPRHLSSDCGYCVRIRTSDAPRALRLMEGATIEYDRVEALIP